MSITHPENQFLDEARLLSISARFGLAMSFLNEFCDRFSIDGLALDQFREHLGGRLAITLPGPVGSKREVNEIDAQRVCEAIEILGKRQRGESWGACRKFTVAALDLLSEYPSWRSLVR